MPLEINRACLNCPVAGDCAIKYADVVYAAAVAENDVQSGEEAFIHRQIAYQNMQELEATALPGEMAEELAIVNRIFGLKFQNEQSIVASKKFVEMLRVAAAQKFEEAQEAREAYDSLVSGCYGPKVISLAGFTVEQCQGKGVSFTKRVILSSF